jgi:hypothetical protein
MKRLDDPRKNVADELAADSVHGASLPMVAEANQTLKNPAHTADERIRAPDDGAILKEGREVEERLKELMQELGNAINESLAESDRISSAIAEIKNAGYEVFLVLEATIGFNKCGDESGENKSEETPAGSRREFQTAGTFKWTSQDQRFLRALKIAVDEEVGS